MPMWVQAVTAVGCLMTLGGVLHVSRQSAPTAPTLGRAHSKRPNVGYENTILPVGACNISSDDGPPAKTAAYPNPDFPTILATAINPHYGVHVVGLGRDGRLYHKYQTSPGPTGNFTGWKCLTNDLTILPCMVAPRCTGYDNAPVIAWQPKNGTLIMFMRSLDDLDVHEMHLDDPKDPESWAPIRAPTCLCNFPPCQTTNPPQTKCGAEANCDEKGVDCSDAQHNGTLPKYWNSQPIFPTSQLSLVADQEDKLNLFFRGFDGNYYFTKQYNAGETNGKWTPPTAVGNNGLME